jgi:RimJ/RimL family protein N-acetyltransferase
MDQDLLPRTSERTILRRLGVADLADFQAYRSDPEVARYQGWEVMLDKDARAFLAAVNGAALFRPGDWSQIGIADRSTDRLIGDVGICIAADEREAEIGFSLARHAQGEGLASEAVREAIHLLFEHTDVGRIVGITDVRNSPSIRLMERIGMEKFEEQETVFRGEPCIEYFFAIARKTED